MVETKDVVVAVFGAATASAALELVFVGIVASTLWSAEGLSNEWRRRFKIAGALSWAAFLVGLVCAGLCTWWLSLHQPDRVYTALVVAFLVQLFLLVVTGTVVLYQAIFFR